MADLTDLEWEAVGVVAKAQAPQRFKQLFAPGVVLTDMTAPGGPWAPEPHHRIKVHRVGVCAPG